MDFERWKKDIFPSCNDSMLFLLRLLVLMLAEEIVS